MHAEALLHQKLYGNYTINFYPCSINYLTKKATPPPCEGALYIGFKGLWIEHYYNDVEHKILYKIKNVLDKEFNQRVTL